MIVRLRFKQAALRPATPTAVQRKAQVVEMPAPVAPAPPENPNHVSKQEMAGGLAALLTPAATLTFAISLWRLGQDLGLTKNFFITEGPFSHWQVWVALTGMLSGSSFYLNRKSEQAARRTATN
ncbi:hypothetical protein [Paludibaculum fermentans]|uniref:Uncharacterized protein n=1 Tax=Paludibaculum fermentans TaxID=1473598 RepID=A0A7S7NSS5_PALFE|nr:hypothetical protein [Paludibaculum fermentans]QOY89059.1 hypothetical protein IRI77_03625 [Paludibaculum fermentans]